MITAVKGNILEYIEKGLIDLVKIIKELGIVSLAIPLLGLRVRRIGMIKSKTAYH